MGEHTGIGIGVSSVAREVLRERNGDRDNHIGFMIGPTARVLKIHEVSSCDGVMAG